LFTGLVTDLGEVFAISGETDKILVIRSARFAEREEIGASVCCNGVCLTVTKIADDLLSFDVSAETLRVTNLGELKKGASINLEASLRMGDPLGGHIVTGHVDCTVNILSMTQEARSSVWAFSLPASHAKFIAPKGSVCLDGVSLTVNAVEADRFSVNIIPHTAEKTRFQHYKTGDRVNLEIDPLARYALNSAQYIVAR
jgi:riboflavin synthase